MGHGIFTKIDVTTEIVNEVLNKIPNISSAGPDGMAPVFLRKGGSFKSLE